MLSNKKQKVYVATVTYDFHGVAVYSDVLCVSELPKKAFEAIEANDYMKVIREETVPGKVFSVASRGKNIGIDNGHAVYSETIYVNVSDCDCGCMVWYNVTEIELA